MKTNLFLKGYDSKGYVKESLLIVLGNNGVLLGGTTDTLNKTGFIVNVSMKELKRQKALLEQLENNCMTK